MSQTQIDLGDDDGYVLVKVAGAEVTLDLWQTNSKIYDYRQANKDKPDEDYNRGLVELIERMGLPKVSFKTASRFVTAIGEAVAEKKEPPSAPAGSPASTESTPDP